LRSIRNYNIVRGVPPETTTLYVEHRGSLVDYATGIVGSRTQAEELVQEAWLRFDEVARQRFLDEPLGYLYRIVRNLALDGRRRSARETEALANGLAEAVTTPGVAATPEMLTLYRDELRLLEQALAELPARTRRAFEMHRLEGCKLREIAERLGISLPLAHKLVSDAIGHCKKRLGWK
jgi:RNA polymerase sigma factor (sigma-70 family)